MWAAVLLLLSALGLRALYLGWTPLWVDEAESSINALSVLEQGYPGDRYLGIQIFENMLSRPWPDHPEYEFRDISYSDRGMCVYHGWLPLYAIAASFRLFAVAPPAPTPGWEVRIDVPDFERRTVVARLPSLLFSGAFLVLLVVVARELSGDDAALAVLVLAGLSTSVVEITVPARYYALTLALSAAACLSLWRLISRDRRRDHALHVAVLVTVFFTHTNSFVNVVAVTTVMAGVFGGRRVFLRWCLDLLVVAACLTPWLIWSGYLEQLLYVPSGRSLVVFPDDLRKYLFNRPPYLVLFGGGTVWLALGWLRHGQLLPARLAEPWQRDYMQYAMLLLWMGVATSTYYLLLPPASLFPQRLSLVLFVPGLLFMAMSLANAARILSHSRATLLAPLFALGFLAASSLLRFPPPAPGAFDGLVDTFVLLNRLQLKPDAKVYASPSSQLVLSFYAQKPIQSLAPVRKSFLDQYPGEVLYIEQQLEWEFASPTHEIVRLVAEQMGQSLNGDEVRALVSQLRSRFARERTRPLVEEVEPPLEPLSPLASALMERAREQAAALAEREESSYASRALPFARGFRIRTGADLWETFFYRLVDPKARSGSRLNAAARLRHGRAYFVPSANRVLFYSPAPISVDSHLEQP